MKAKDLLLDEETLFRDESVFTPSYVPADFIHRDDQLKELSISLKPGLRGVNPINTLLHGPPGTGKTTAIKYMFEQVNEASSKLVTVYVNCEDSNTRFSIFAKIHEAIFGTLPPDTGKPLEAIKDKVFTKLKREGKSIVIALDEIDYLFVRKLADKVLMDLLKSYSSYGYDKIGVVGILIDDKYLTDLALKTKSIFDPVKIYFPPYTAKETGDILKNRVNYGFYDGVISDELLDEIVNKTMQHGDLRVGINLLRKSANLAERDASRKITKEHIEQAYEGDSKLLNLKRSVKPLDGEEKALLKLIASTETAKAGDLYEIYSKETGSGMKKYNQILEKLEFYKLIDLTYTKGAKGRSRNVVLRHDSKEVLKLL